jgi:hypothetical protein
MKIFITGDSHMRALKRGVEMLINQGEMPDDFQFEAQMLSGGNAMAKPYFVDKGDFVEFVGRLKRLPFPEEHGTYDYFGMCGLLHATRLWRIVKNWSNCTPFEPKEDQIPISISLLRHVVFQEQMYNMQLIEIFMRIGIKVFVIEAPKPFKHSKAMIEGNPEINCYVDSYYKNIMTEWLDSKGVPIIRVPSECYDDNGFMYKVLPIV